jgi:hypothetical protein
MKSIENSTWEYGRTRELANIGYRGNVYPTLSREFANQHKPYLDSLEKEGLIKDVTSDQSRKDGFIHYKLTKLGIGLFKKIFSPFLTALM